MQKMTKRERTLLLMLVLLAFYGCADDLSERKARPEAAQQLLKLRGYEFDEKSFHAAAGARDLMAISAFLDARIDPNARNAEGRTALISAAAQGHPEVVKLLVERGADVNVRDNKGYTALLHALEARYDEVSEILLNHPKLDPNAAGLNGHTALIIYAWRESKDAVQKLLDRGAKANAQDNDGDSALHGASQNGNVEILDILIAKGADVNLKNKQGGTSLMWAAVFGHEEAARRLLEHGADPSLKDSEGNTALDWAIRNNRPGVVNLLKRRTAVTKAED